MNEGRGLPPETTCLINPKAANSKWMRKKKLRDYLHSRLPGRIHDVMSNKENTVELSRRTSVRSQILIAIGGDGTIADVIQGIMEAGRHKDVALGIIPFGSGNAFRKSFGIRKNTRKAIRQLIGGYVREVDLRKGAGRYGGFAAGGATAAATPEKRNFSYPNLFAHLANVPKFFSGFDTLKTIELFDGEDDRGGEFRHQIVESRFFDCVVSKTNHFGYSWRVAPRARVDDGYLHVTLFETGPWRYILNFPLIYSGIYQRTQRHFKAKKIIIRGKALPVQYHGEFIGVRDQVEFTVVPRSLRIICPRPGSRRRGRRKTPAAG